MLVYIYICVCVSHTILYYDIGYKEALNNQSSQAVQNFNPSNAFSNPIPQSSNLYLRDFMLGTLVPHNPIASTESNVLVQSNHFHLCVDLIYGIVVLFSVRSLHISAQIHLWARHC